MIEPPPTRWSFPDPRSAGLDDVVAVGADLEPGTIITAYRRGMFPMHLRDGRLAWWSPVERAILPLEGLRVSRSLAKSMRRYRMTVDTDCAKVIAGCAADRPERWITAEMEAAYLELHRLGWVHSVEIWDGAGELSGGLYGVGIGGLFAGESMFHRGRDASKVALVHLVRMMADAGGMLLDVQWLTPHLASLGAVVIGREDYLRRLPTALAAPSPWL
jgi:leucyl/phenylalanyl-tRNA--protein transferase